MTTVDQLYNSLKKDIDISDLGPASTFLGIEIQRDRQKRLISLSQSSYSKRLLDKFGYKLLETIKALISISNKIAPNYEDTSIDIVKDYQQQIDSIIYLITKTRPNLAYLVGLYARFMSNPGLEHFKALEKIQKYLIHTWNFALVYQSPPQGVTTYCDVDQGGDLATRRSTIGYFCTYRGGAIAWNLRLQRTVTLSSYEAEFIALKEAIKEQLFIKSILSELQHLIGDTTAETVYTDSKSAIDLAKDPLHHHRTKYIDI